MISESGMNAGFWLATIIMLVIGIPFGLHIAAGLFVRYSNFRSRLRHRRYIKRMYRKPPSDTS